MKNSNISSTTTRGIKYKNHFNFKESGELKKQKLKRWIGAYPQKRQGSGERLFQLDAHIQAIFFFDYYLILDSYRTLGLAFAKKKNATKGNRKHSSFWQLCGAVWQIGNCPKCMGCMWEAGEVGKGLWKSKMKSFMIGCFKQGSQTRWSGPASNTK